MKFLHGDSGDTDQTAQMFSHAATQFLLLQLTGVPNLCCLSEETFDSWLCKEWPAKTYQNAHMFVCLY